MAAKSIAILGAGLTGLTAAHRLVRNGHRVRVLESGGRIGGAIRTESAVGWLVERGAGLLPAGTPALQSLISELALGSEVLPAAPSARRVFVARRNRLFPLPTSYSGLLASGLFSLSAKAKLLRETLARPRVRTADVGLADFVRSHFGDEVVEYALNPFIAAAFAGRPEKLSARYALPSVWEWEQKHGSLLRSLHRAYENVSKPSCLFSFRRGLQTLPDALAARIGAERITLNARLEALVPGKPWNVIWNDGTTTVTESFDAVIAALPAPALAQVRIGTLGERPLASLDAIEHPPLATLFLGYRRDQVAHPLDGFGLMMPAAEQRQTLAVLFSSSLFPLRAPGGHVALTVLLGGARQPELARLPAAEALAAVEGDLHDLLGVQGSPVVQHHTFWPRSLPQYAVGHGGLCEAMIATEQGHRGLFIGGPARDGIFLPASIAAGERLAERAGR